MVPSSAENDPVDSEPTDGFCGVNDEVLTCRLIRLAVTVMVPSMLKFPKIGAADRAPLYRPARIDPLVQLLYTSLRIPVAVFSVRVPS